MSRWRRGVIALAVGFLFSVTRAGAIDTDPKSGILIEVRTPFNKSGPNGYAPVRVRIKNGSQSDGRWSLLFQSPGNQFHLSGTQRVTSRFVAFVGAGSEREFDCFVPMPTVAAGSFSPELSLNVSGPGVRDGAHTFPSSSHRGSGRDMGVIGFSDKLAGRLKSDLSAALKAKGINENFSVVELSRLPPDWRALSAFDQIWITTGEWESLPTGVRMAFEQWMATGGVLTKCGPGAADATQKSGLGAVRTFPFDSTGSLDVEKVIGKMKSPGLTSLGESFAGYSLKWPDKKWIPPFNVNVPLLILVIVLFGIVVGPVNIFLFAGKENRARIFWTTPLISLIGTLVICLTIVVQDGFGGWGKRLALIVIQPDRHSEVIVQEQASKTAVLTSSGFRFDPSAVIRQLPTNNRSLGCSVEGAEYFGDWFRSRSIQGQLITAIRPTRAEIKLLNAGEVAGGQPPRILSQIAGQLDSVYYQAADGRVFRADDVGPGRETIMRPCDLKDATSGLKNDFFGVAGPRILAQSLLAGLEKGWFYGLSKSARAAMLPTLAQIRWTDDRALYLCPATVNP